MIYVYKDGTGWQAFPEPNASVTPYIEVTGDDEARILAGDPYRVDSTQTTVTFPPLAEIEAEQAAAALEAERAGMIVSRFQARAALYSAGLLALAEAEISQGSDLAQMAWADAQEFRRNSPTVAAIAGALSLTDEQLDDLFRQAKTIEA